MEPNKAPTIVNDAADIHRLNTLLDQITARPYLSPTIAVQAIRGALDIHGLKLPHIDIESQAIGPNQQDALSYLSTGKRADRETSDTEYLFKIVDADRDEDLKHGVAFDWDDRLYLYIVMDRHEDIGVWEVFAQICDVDEVDDLLHADIPDALLDQPEDLHGKDVNGESPYLRQIRHSGTGGFNGEA